MAKGDTYLENKEQDELLKAISEGLSVNKHLKNVGIDWRKVYRTLDHDSSFLQNYARAREQQADVFIEKIWDVCDKLEKRTIDPQSAKVIIDSLKWTASKLKPKTWGEKARVDVVVSNKLSMIDYLISQQSGALKNVTPPQGLLSVGQEEGGGG